MLYNCIDTKLKLMCLSSTDFTTHNFLVNKSLFFNDCLDYLSMLYSQIIIDKDDALDKITPLNNICTDNRVKIINKTKPFSLRLEQ